jgi:GT2 family glycosyltransferase
MNEQPSVAIIILNWNGFNDTVECLTSLRQIRYQNHKIILLDNGSENNEGNRLKDLFPEIQLVLNKTNRGFAGGNNDAINFAMKNDFKYIVCLNNDCLVEQNWLTNLIEGIGAARADFASSRIMFYPQTELIYSDGDIVLPDGSGLSINHLKSQQATREVTDIYRPCAAASIYSVESLQDVKINENQFFDELYLAYFEDMDLGIRLNAKSYRGACIPDAVVYHKGSRTSGNRSFFQVFQLEKNRILNELLNYPFWLIPLGELCYLFKTAGRMLRKNTREKGAEPVNTSQLSFCNRLSILWQSRAWILLNLPELLRDRKERRRRGLINRKITDKFFQTVLEKTFA